jgi:uncharacterized protein
MKYLVVIAIVFLVLWLWRGSRREEEQEGLQANAPRPAPRIEQQEMIRCPVCNVHFPRSDALPGPDGQLYCCAEHRARAQQRSHAEG